MSSGTLQATGELGIFLRNTKAAFKDAIHKDGAKSWTIVMGNEAGDLDSLASAIGYAYFASTLQNPAIPLVQMPRADLDLRAENVHALHLASLSAHLEDLLYLDEVPSDRLGASFALVDHNSLLPRWKRDGAIISGILDHHEDDGNHSDTSLRRIVVPLGSCASLVADTFKDRWSLSPSPPPELATLLLTAIYIDTGALKPNGKAQQLDFSSAALLESVHFPSSSVIEARAPPFRSEIFQVLIEKKNHVSHLSGRDLLRRDYKQYSYSTVNSGPEVHVGLSTVPMGFKEWLQRDDNSLRAAVKAWGQERALDVVGVLTSFRTLKKGHHRRQLLIFVPELEATEGKENLDREALFELLVKGLEGTDILDLRPLTHDNEEDDDENPSTFDTLSSARGDASDRGRLKAWRQKNSDATRKQVAPAFKSILENGSVLSGKSLGKSGKL